MFKSARKTVGFYLEEGFPFIAFAGATEALNRANRAAGHPLYRWRVITESGSSVRSANQVWIEANHSIASSPGLDWLFVLAGETSLRRRDETLLAWLRHYARHGTEIGGIDTGGWILADAGLLDERRATVHWNCLQAFKERFSRVEAVNRVFTEDGKVATAAGGTAALDLVLHKIARDVGAEVAAEAAEDLLYDHPRGPEQRQRAATIFRLSHGSGPLSRAIKLMEDTMEDPLSGAEVAERVGVSLRQLERLFQRRLDMSPQRFYKALRLEHANRLLTQSDLSITEIAVATGFASASHFARCFREAYGQTPSESRRNALKAA